MSTDSPCVDMCGMDRRSGWCRGCGRTAPEIRAWQKMQPGTRKMVLNDLKRRLQRLRDQGRVQDDRGPMPDTADNSTAKSKVSRHGSLGGIRRAVPKQMAD